ncbi:MAG: PaaI family thioesterase, partial [Acidimicrobiales bacterium]
VELEVTDEMRGPGGAVHGGLVASLVDRAGAYAVARDSRRPVATSNVALSFLASASAGPLRAAATALRIGRRQGVAEVKVYDTGRDDRLVATAVVTLSYLPDDSAQPRVGGDPARTAQETAPG